VNELNKKKVLTIVGTRPEAIKLAPVIKELDRCHDSFISVVCITAQHRDMLDQALSPFNIVPDYDLDIMKPDQTLAQVTARAVEKLHNIIDREQPDVVLVQGDTTTAFCGALVAYYHQIKVGHVEAGLRTRHKYAPFPEEVNRALIAQIADYHFAPTELARNALLNEGVDPATVYVTGNTIIDALLWVRNQVKLKSPTLPYGLGVAIDGRQMVLVTGHRRESFGEGFENICKAIRKVVDMFPEVVFVYPVHLNPNVQEPVKRILRSHDRIVLVEPVAYEPFVWLMDRATLVLTDSGGVQEEAPSLGKPVLVMRETTERPEGIDAGNAVLVGTGMEKIIAELSRLLRYPDQRLAMANVKNPYGDGRASERIVEILRNNL